MISSTNHQMRMNKQAFGEREVLQGKMNCVAFVHAKGCDFHCIASAEDKQRMMSLKWSDSFAGACWWLNEPVYDHVMCFSGAMDATSTSKWLTYEIVQGIFST